MNNRACDLVGCEFPLFAFSHCRDVVAAVSRAGGFGVFGASGYTPEQLDIELKWIDEHVNGKPYGVDVLIPENISPEIDDRASGKKLADIVPLQHRVFTANLLAEHGVPVNPGELISTHMPPLSLELAEQLLDVAFSYPIRLIANALGIAPQQMINRGKANGVPVAALVGAREHALRQVEAGVDIIVAQGGEAGGHCGEISTLVLVPEVIQSVKKKRDVPVLAAGGIMSGGQMAGCMAMGADGVWTGSVWLATVESETSEAFRQKMIAARSRDTVRSKTRTGKFSRQLRSAWHDAWEGEDSPGALPMPLMILVSKPAFERIDRSVESGNEKALPLVSYFVGQGVGMVSSIKSAGQVVQEFKEEFAESYLSLQKQIEI